MQIINALFKKFDEKEIVFAGGLLLGGTMFAVATLIIIAFQPQILVEFLLCLGVVSLVGLYMIIAYRIWQRTKL